MGGAAFFPDSKPLFSKRRPQDKFLYQKSTKFENCLEDISQYVDFGPKRGKFVPKRAQNGWNQIFPNTFTGLFHK